MGVVCKLAYANRRTKEKKIYSPFVCTTMASAKAVSML